MAKLDRSYVRLRFSFGKSNVKGRQRFENTAAFIVGKVTVAFADEMWETARDKLQAQVQQDVHRELVNMAYLFRRHINQQGGTRSGVLTSAVGNARPLALSSALPAWAPRNAQYLERKFEATGSDKWFNNSGWKTRRRPGRHALKMYPKDPGRLVQEIEAPMFETVYGPIKVSITRNNKALPHDADGYIEIGKKRNNTLQVASIRVSALGRITPAVLSTLRTGNFAGVENPELPAMIKHSSVPYADEIGTRLGPTSRGRYRPGATGVYRPTLEPFLGFFLTRALPAAVSRRVAQANLGRVVRKT